MKNLFILQVILASSKDKMKEAFWPYLLITTNDNWLVFMVPALITALDFFLYKKNIPHHEYIFLLLPFIHPAYLFFPVLYWLLNWSNKSMIIYGILALLITIFKFNSFYPYSVFVHDPLRFDTLIKKINLIPNRNMARIFENKTTIPIEKFSANFFLGLDLNNYFFALHPRELVGENQNLQKFPYLSIIFFLLGLYHLGKNKDYYWIVSVFFSVALSVSLINNPDKYDFLLFVPICLIIFSGVKHVFIK